MHAKGAKVKQKVFAIEGEVMERRLVELDDNTAEVEYHVGFVQNGEPAARWFKASELEAPVEAKADKQEGK